MAEPYTNKKGEWLPLRDTLEDVRRILDGAADAMESKQLSFIGRLELEGNNQKK